MWISKAKDVRPFPLRQLDLNPSFLPLISPFKSLDARRIQQNPHLQITASIPKPLELKVTNM